jgi:hypothetical protein
MRPFSRYMQSLRAGQDIHASMDAVHTRKSVVGPQLTNLVYGYTLDCVTAAGQRIRFDYLFYAFSY